MRARGTLTVTGNHCIVASKNIALLSGHWLRSDMECGREYTDSDARNRLIGQE